jgi:hypothetical protein
MSYDKEIIDEALLNAKIFVAILLKNNIINNEGGFDIYIEVLQGGTRHVKIIPKPTELK